MKALTWQGKRDVRVEEVPDPRIEEPTDAVIRITSTAVCGSDLHLYEVLGPYLKPGDVLGHEPMGIVEEVGPEVTRLKPGDRVVVPFTIACGSCWMCDRQLYAHCETTQVTSEGKGAADTPPGGTLAVFGLGPVGQFCTRVARHLGAGRVIGLDLVPERLEMARRHGVEVLDVSELDDVPGALVDLVDGRGPDAVIDAVGMEAHGAPAGKLAQTAAGLLPDKLARTMTDKAGVDRLVVLKAALKAVRRGGTVSISGVYGGEVDPLPLMEMFDRGVQLRMGQCHVRRWTDEIMPLLSGDDDPLGVEDLRTHRLPLQQAPQAYEMFQKKQDGCVKVVLAP